MKDFNDRSRIAYNKKADHYNDTSDGKFTQSFKNFLLEKMIFNDNDTVLDVACGNGKLLNMLSQIKRINGIGIDISEQMIKNAAIQNTGMLFKVAGCENIPLEDNSADIITVSAAFHHFPDVNAFAKEAARVIRTGGRLYIAEVYLPPILRVICNPFIPFSNEGDVKFYSSKEIVQIFAAHGFNCQNIFIDGHIQIIHLSHI